MDHKYMSKMGKTISGVVLFTLIAKAFGFLRELILSYYFGATGMSDAYLVSQNIPGTIFMFVGTGLTTCFVPIYYRVLHDKGKNKVDKFTNQIITLVLAFSTAVIIVVWMFTPFVVKAFASGFTGDTLYYAIWFTRINIFSLWISSILYVYNSYLQVNQRFNIVAFAAIPNSICIILAIVLGAKVNIWLLSIVSVVAVGVQVLVMLPSIHDVGLRFRLDARWNNTYVRDFLKLMIPVILGVSVNEVNTLVDRTIASQVAVGGISALTYGNSLIQLIQGGLVQPIATIFYPQVTESISKGDDKQAKHIIEKSLTILITILIPITVIFFDFGEQIVEILFARGAFNQNAVAMTTSAIQFYSIGICFVAMREMVSRFYYAHANTNIPMLNATIGVIINILMNLVFSRIIGVGGLALATSMSAIVTTFLLWKDSKKICEGERIKIEYRQIIKSVLASIVMGEICKLIYNRIIDLGTIGVGVTILTACILYLVMAFVLRLDITSFIIQTVKHKVKNDGDSI